METTPNYCVVFYEIVGCIYKKRRGEDQEITTFIILTGPGSSRHCPRRTTGQRQSGGRSGVRGSFQSLPLLGFLRERDKASQGEQLRIG